MQEARLIIYRRIQELVKQISDTEVQIFVANSKRMKDIYKKKLSGLVAAKMLNESIYYGTGTEQ